MAAFNRQRWPDSFRFDWPLSPLYALYLAKDIETGFCEMFGPGKDEELDRFELALAEEKSLTLISIYGELDSVVDLTKPEGLKPFVNLIKDFYPSGIVKHMANEIKRKINVVKTVDDLLKTVLDPNWRAYPMHVEIPANSQIFGQLVSSAGIEGILYPSKYTEKNCLAIFPPNLKGGDSFVEIMDEAPKGVDIKRLDSKTWEKLI